jgi:predicted component of type VI protein secretion system
MQEEAITKLATIARALATPQVAPIAKLLELRTKVSELKGAI